MTRQRFLLVVLLAWALVMIVPDLLRVATPLGSFGFYADNDGLIYDVVGPFEKKEDSPAWKAGIRVGDRLAMREMLCYPYDRNACRNALMLLGGHQFVLPGRQATLPLKATDGQPARQITLVGVQVPANPFERFVLLSIRRILDDARHKPIQLRAGAAHSIKVGQQFVQLEPAGILDDDV